MGWLFAFDVEILELSLALLLLAAFSAYFAIGASCKLVYDNQAELLPSSKGKINSKLTQLFVVNYCIFNWAYKLRKNMLFAFHSHGLDGSHFHSKWPLSAGYLALHRLLH